MHIPALNLISLAWWGKRLTQYGLISSRKRPPGLDILRGRLRGLSNIHELIGLSLFENEEHSDRVLCFGAFTFLERKTCIVLSMFVSRAIRQNCLSSVCKYLCSSLIVRLLNHYFTTRTGRTGSTGRTVEVELLSKWYAGHHCSTTCTTLKPLFHDLNGSHESWQAIHGSYLLDSSGQGCLTGDFTICWSTEPHF